MNDELNSKLGKIDRLLAEREFDALLVQRVTNFAWLTCGAASYINTADEAGVASLLITPSGRYLITNNIEAPRFKEEEQLVQQGWVFEVSPWNETVDVLENLIQDHRLATDGLSPRGVDINTELIRLRADLHSAEQSRFRDLGSGCAQAMKSAISAVEPGMTEFDIAGVLAQETLQRGILPIVNLIATDQRIFSFRHPLPTSKVLNRYAMLVLCGRKKGLVASITRLVHFGALSEEILRKSQAVASVDATFIAATRPGQTLGQIFEQARMKYAEVGYPDEWKLHHQGGPAGYAPREAIATAHEGWVVKAGQAFAWNPSITGTKSEDTILVMDDGYENMTEIPGWPEIQVDLDGEVISRPAILAID